MVECTVCKKTGIKVRDTIAAFIDGKSVLVCRTCAKGTIGEQKPNMYFKKIE